MKATKVALVQSRISEEVGIRENTTRNAICILSFIVIQGTLMTPVLIPKERLSTTTGCNHLAIPSQDGCRSNNLGYKIFEVRQRILNETFGLANYHVYSVMNGPYYGTRKLEYGQRCPSRCVSRRRNAALRKLTLKTTYESFQNENDGQPLTTVVCECTGDRNLEQSGIEVTSLDSDAYDDTIPAYKRRRIWAHNE